MRKPSYLTHEEYALTKVALAREEVPAEAFALLYRDAEEGWKLLRIRRDSPDAQLVPMLAARTRR